MYESVLEAVQAVRQAGFDSWHWDPYEAGAVVRALGVYLRRTGCSVDDETALAGFVRNVLEQHPAEYGFPDDQTKEGNEGHTSSTHAVKRARRALKDGDA